MLSDFHSAQQFNQPLPLYPNNQHHNQHHHTHHHRLCQGACGHDGLWSHMVALAVMQAHNPHHHLQAHNPHHQCSSCSSSCSSMLIMLIIMLINAHKHTILTINPLFMLFIGVIVVAVTVVLATIFGREWDLEQIFKFPQSADTSLYLRILCSMRV